MLREPETVHKSNTVFIDILIVNCLGQRKGIGVKAASFFLLGTGAALKNAAPEH
jgi:hypothetical protein